MPDYIKISTTLKKLNLSHLEETFKAYGIHDNIVLTSQLTQLLPNYHEQFRRQFSEELKQDLENVQSTYGGENQSSKSLRQSSTQEDMLNLKQTEVLHEEKSTQTEMSTETADEILPTQTASRSQSTSLSEETKKHLKTAGIITASVVGASALAVVAAPLAIAAAGFGSAGVVAGSLAASWQGTMGGYVAASSLFATLQSVGVVGLSTAATASIGLGGAAVGGVTAGGIVALTNKNEKKDQGTQTSETES